MFDDERFHVPQFADFEEHDFVVGFHQQTVAFFFEAEQAVAGHVVFDFGNDGRWHGIAALAI